MFKAYCQFQEAQWRWIRQHPIQYITLNVILCGMFIGYIYYKDRKFQREIENEIAQQES